MVPQCNTIYLPFWVLLRLSRKYFGWGRSKCFFLATCEILDSSILLYVAMVSTFDASCLNTSLVWMFWFLKSSFFGFGSLQNFPLTSQDLTFAEQRGILLTLKSGRCGLVSRILHKLRKLIFIVKIWMIPLAGIMGIRVQIPFLGVVHHPSGEFSYNHDLACNICVTSCSTYFAIWFYN